MKIYKETRNMIGQEFGGNRFFDYTKFGILGHDGTDFGCPTGTPIYFGGEKGMVYETKWGSGGGNILHIIEERDGKTYKHQYGHLKKFLCSIGDEITRGDVIALSDNTGSNTTGPHLHRGLYEVEETRNAYQIKNYDNGYLGAIPIEWDIFVLDTLDRSALIKQVLKTFIKTLRFK